MNFLKNDLNVSVINCSLHENTPQVWMVDVYFIWKYVHTWILIENFTLFRVRQKGLFSSNMNYKILKLALFIIFTFISTHDHI